MLGREDGEDKGEGRKGREGKEEEDGMTGWEGEEEKVGKIRVFQQEQKGSGRSMKTFRRAEKRDEGNRLSGPRLTHLF